MNMAKRLIALLLVAMMLLAFVACDNGSKVPAGGTDAKTDDKGTQAPDGTTGGDKNDDNPAEYVPDPDCPYSGAIGVGASAGTVYFDDLKLRNRGAGGGDLIENVNFEETDKIPAFTGLGTTDAVQPTIVKDPTKADDAETTKSSLSVASGTALVTGNTVWNRYQLTVKVMLADDSSAADVYFCVKDAKNYYVLTLGENNNTNITCYKVENGEKTNAQFTAQGSLSTEKFTSVGVTLEKDTIMIYVDGNTVFDLANENFAKYQGAMPASLESTPEPEGMKYFRVNATNIIHDGKGTWNNVATTSALAAFDGDTTTFYDCDEKNEGDPPTADVLVGKEYGDYTDTENNAVGYCGGHFEKAFILKQVRLYPRDGFASSKTDGTDRVLGCTIQASNDGKEWVTLYTIETLPTEGQFTIIDLENTTAYTYYRYYSRAESYCNVNELELWGIEG